MTAMRSQGEQVMLPVPDAAHEHTGCMDRVYELADGTCFALFSAYPDVIRDNHVVPAREYMAGMFGEIGGIDVGYLQHQLEASGITAELTSAVWIDVNYSLNRLLKVQARDVPRLLELLRNHRWQSRAASAGFPSIHGSQVALLHAETRTGIVLALWGRRHVGRDEKYMVFDSLADAETYARRHVERNTEVECWIFGPSGDQLALVRPRWTEGEGASGVNAPHYT